MCTTPLAPRAAPGSCSSSTGRLPFAGERVSRSPLRLRSVPDPLSGGRAATVVRPISLRPVSATVIFAPADGTSTRSDALPSVPMTSTSYEPIGTAGKMKRPWASVCACKATLLPTAVTFAPFTGWPFAVTVPASDVAACTNAAPHEEAIKRKTRQNVGAMRAARRWSSTKTSLYEKKLVEVRPGMRSVADGWERTVRTLMQRRAERRRRAAARTQSGAAQLRTHERAAPDHLGARGSDAD